MKSRRFQPLTNTISFAFATMLAAVISAVALGFVFVGRQGVKSDERGNSNRALLADKQRALRFYLIFSAAYDILNPSFYTDKMRSNIVSLIEKSNCLDVLDVGCGTGYTTKGILARKNVNQVVGLDMNPVQLGRAAKNLKAERNRAILSRGDAEHLPFRDEAFGTVISVGAIENFAFPELAVSEMVRVTKSGGVVVVGAPELTWFRKVSLDRFLYTPSIEQVKSLLARSGLKEEKDLLTGVNTFFGTRNYVVVAVGRK